MTRKVTEAVAYAHGQGVIHRDLKPSNILLAAPLSPMGRGAGGEGFGEPKITDFGLAKRVEADSDLTATGQVLGTPSYMPPEQAAGKLEQIKETSDVYALGAVLYTLLAGRPPFQADNPLDTLMQVMEQEPVSPRQLNPNVPRDLETICLKCLEKDPNQRYQTARALADELRRFLTGEPIRARPIGSAARACRWCKRKPVVAVLSGTVAVLLLFLAVAGPVVAVRQTSLRREAEQGRDQADEARKKEAEARKRAEANLYFNRIALAHRSWLANDVAGAQRLLDACPTELRHWEWGYLNRLCHLARLTLRGHGGFVHSVAFSPHGKRIVSGSMDGTLKVWDASSGEETFTLRGHTREVYSVAFSPDGKRIVSGSFDRTLKVWDASSGEETLPLRGHRVAVRGVAFSPDGKWIVSGSQGRLLKGWDASSGEETFTLRGHTGWVHSVAFSPNGKWIVSGSYDRTLKVWNASSGKETCTLRGHTGEVRGVAFSPDGKRIVSGSLDRTLKVWDASSGEETFTLRGHTGWVHSVAFSPDGKRILSGSFDKTLKVWDDTIPQRANDARNANSP